MWNGFHEWRLRLCLMWHWSHELAHKSASPVQVQVHDHWVAVHEQVNLTKEQWQVVSGGFWVNGKLAVGVGNHDVCSMHEQQQVGKTSTTLTTALATTTQGATS